MQGTERKKFLTRKLALFLLGLFAMDALVFWLSFFIFPDTRNTSCFFHRNHIRLIGILRCLISIGIFLPYDRLIFRLLFVLYLS